MATFKAVILKGVEHTKSDGTTNLKIRITHNRKADYISTDFFVVPDKSKKGFTYGDNAKFIIDRTTDYISKYQKAYIALGDAADRMTVKEVKRAVVGEKKEKIDFIKFADDYMHLLEVSKKDGSIRAVRGLISNLKKYSPTLTFDQVDSTYLKNFETWMKAEGVKNGIQSYMARFRVIFNEGRKMYNDEDRGLIRIANYPFKKYKIVQPLGSAKDSCLTIEQMRMLIAHQPVFKRSKMAKDMFLLQFCLIGINTKDLYFANKPEKGRLVFDRFKTERPYSIRLEPEAIEIIERYKGKKTLLNVSDTFTTDYLNFQTAINKGLKEICNTLHKNFEAKRTPEQIAENVELDFPRKITSNWARHTWATIGRNDCQIDKDDVALCLGHEDQDNRVTDLYIKYDYSIIDRSNRKVINAILKPHGRTATKNTETTTE